LKHLKQTFLKECDSSIGVYIQTFTKELIDLNSPPLSQYLSFLVMMAIFFLIVELKKGIFEVLTL